MRRSSFSTTPLPVQFPLKSQDTLDSQTIFKADTFTCSTEDFLTSDTTYVAQLREELWQALASHVAARTLQKVDAALDCLEEVCLGELCTTIRRFRSWCLHVLLCLGERVSGLLLRAIEWGCSWRFGLIS